MAYVLMRWASRLQIHSDSTSPRRRGIKPLRGEQNKWDQDDTRIEQSVSESMTVCHLFNRLKERTGNVKPTQRILKCLLLCTLYRWSQTHHWNKQDKKQKQIFCQMFPPLQLSHTLTWEWENENFKCHLYFASLPINWTIHRRVITVNQNHQDISDSTFCM